MCVCVCVCVCVCCGTGDSAVGVIFAQFNRRQRHPDSGLFLLFAAAWSGCLMRVVGYCEPMFPVGIAVCPLCVPFVADVQYDVVLCCVLLNVCASVTLTAAQGRMTSPWCGGVTRGGLGWHAT